MFRAASRHATPPAPPTIGTTLCTSECSRHDPSRAPTRPVRRMNEQGTPNLGSVVRPTMGHEGAPTGLPARSWSWPAPGPLLRPLAPPFASPTARSSAPAYPRRRARSRLLLGGVRHLAGDGVRSLRPAPTALRPDALFSTSERHQRRRLASRHRTCPQLSPPRALSERNVAVAQRASIVESARSLGLAQGQDPSRCHGRRHGGQTEGVRPGAAGPGTASPPTGHGSSTTRCVTADAACRQARAEAPSTTRGSGTPSPRTGCRSVLACGRLVAQKGLSRPCSHAFRAVRDAETTARLGHPSARATEEAPLRGARAPARARQPTLLVRSASTSATLFRYTAALHALLALVLVATRGCPACLIQAMALLVRRWCRPDRPHGPSPEIIDHGTPTFARSFRSAHAAALAEHISRGRERPFAAGASRSRRCAKSLALRHGGLPGSVRRHAGGFRAGCSDA